MQKKRVANGARHRVCGSKSKKCSLPHDNLTPAQRKKLDGPVSSYSPTRYMPWEAFKHLPLDLQQEHLDYIQDRFRVGVNTISKVVFGLTGSTLRFHCERRGIRFQKFPGTVNAKTMAALENWLNPEETCADTVQEEAPAEEERTPAVRMPDLRDLPALMCGGEVRMSGLASELLPALAQMIGCNDAYMSVHFRFTPKKEENEPCENF